ncbi:hypothetical protein ACQPYK_47870 [Streptosporangium sp. CA-135522]|uniref:hypothetical protein n=1 Tax=Streptosporangium sp. CA-135522 TaxID=3240072 RepID=UPI003D8AFCC1
MRQRRGLLGAAILATCMTAPALAGFGGTAAFAGDQSTHHPHCRESGHDRSLLGRLLRIRTDPAPTCSEPESPATPEPSFQAQPTVTESQSPDADHPETDPPTEPDYPAEPDYPSEPGYPTPEPPYPTAPPPPTPMPPKPPTPRPSAVRPAEPPPPRPRPRRIAVAPEAVPSPTPSPSPPPTPTPTPTLSPAPRLLERHLVLDRFAERRRGTDRRMVILVVFTGVISVTAVAALNGKARR